MDEETRRIIALGHALQWAGTWKNSSPAVGTVVDAAQQFEKYLLDGEL